MRCSLRNRLLLVAGVVLALGSPCFPRNVSRIRSVDFRNFTYEWDGMNVVLRNGKHSEGDHVSWSTWTLMPVKYVDLDNDGREEAFVVLDYRTSGTYDHGQAYFVFAYLHGVVRILFHESREKPVNAHVRNRRIVIQAPFWVDGGLCCPSGIETSAYVWRNGRFVRASTKRRYVNS